MTCPWVNMILNAPGAKEAWGAIFSELKHLALAKPSPVELHNQTIVPDRLLSEAAWELWELYPSNAARTSQALIEWCRVDPAGGKAVLILDAMSLRELPLLLGGAEKRGVTPVQVTVTGSEVPSETEDFAKALGASNRAGLYNNKVPAAFKPFGRMVHTDVFDHPFADCISTVPHDPNLFIWHTWLDKMIHVYQRTPDQIFKQTSTELQSDGFWKFIDRLRQGRRLIITSDHGYAVSRDFSSDEKDVDAIKTLRETFGGSRYTAKTKDFKAQFMPPLILATDHHLVVMGQKKWPVQSGFPYVCHGGLSLLEVAVPFIELPAL